MHVGLSVGGCLFRFSTMHTAAAGKGVHLYPALVVDDLRPNDVGGSVKALRSAVETGHLPALPLLPVFEQHVLQRRVASHSFLSTAASGVGDRLIFSTPSAISQPWSGRCSFLGGYPDDPDRPTTFDDSDPRCPRKAAKGKCNKPAVRSACQYSCGCLDKDPLKECQARAAEGRCQTQEAKVGCQKTCNWCTNKRPVPKEPPMLPVNDGPVDIRTGEVR
eukprot:gnl/TRDRNA2_/TRDRNA2_82561_c2_seq2.p1 gnl/TRDRNA2_/TRDRNA2_82561_c2~~gnl/TRDRNA2_/TRDRNA2_82561_c2_seq2.p1  ORF type:complete len:219 (+),score=12.49 gnl/TRDRNA2_/TRDRNA2_82561_c2_seq2:46-702(+)